MIPGPPDPREWALRIDVSEEAIAVYSDCDVIDLHVDTSVPMRLLGYDAARPHTPVVPGVPCMWQVDLPRLRAAGVSGLVWDIPTNPLRPAARRAAVAAKNLEAQRELFARFDEDFQLVRTVADYRRARRQDRTAVWLSIQGGQALDHEIGAIDQLPEGLLHRVTLVHLTPSRIGAPSSLPRRAHQGLTAFGREFVAALNARRVVVDLAHINRQGFWDALDAHDSTIPLIASHTGVCAVHRMWRNLEDDQLRAIADLGGTIGIIFHPSFLAPTARGCLAARIVDHMEHVIKLVGEDHVSIGSDFDGMILLPRDLRDVTELPRLVQTMLHRRWSHSRIAKIMGGNYLRVVEAICG